MIATETDHPYIFSSAESLLPIHAKHQATNIVLPQFESSFDAVNTRRYIGCGRHFGIHHSHLKIPVECSSLYTNPLEAFLWMAMDRRYVDPLECYFEFQVELELTDHVTERCFNCSLDEFVTKLDLDNTHHCVESGMFKKKLIAVMCYHSNVTEDRNRLIVTTRHPNNCYYEVNNLFAIQPNSIVKKQKDYNMLFESKWSKVLFIFACADKATHDKIVANVSRILSKYGNRTRTAFCFDFNDDAKRLIVTTTWLTACHYGCAKLIVAAYEDVVIVLPHQYIRDMYEKDIVVQEYISNEGDCPNHLLWINVRKTLLRICLAFHSFNLPVYVLLEIFDWLGIAWLFPRLIKVETIEMMLQSIRRVKGPK